MACWCLVQKTPPTLAFTRSAIVDVRASLYLHYVLFQQLFRINVQLQLTHQIAVTIRKISICPSMCNQPLDAERCGMELLVISRTGKLGIAESNLAELTDVLDIVADEPLPAVYGLLAEHLESLDLHSQAVYLGT
jgi:hypothetical protein